MFIRKIALFLSITSTLCLISCGDPNIIDTPDGEIDVSKKDYLDYKEFFLDDLTNFYSYEGRYSVQLYYDTCKYCKEARPYLFRHLEQYKSGAKKSKTLIYDMKKSTTEEGMINRQYFKKNLDDLPKEKCIQEMLNNKVSDVKDTYYFSVPSLYVIENNKLVEFYSGSTDIINYYRYLD